MRSWRNFVCLADCVHSEQALELQCVLDPAPVVTKCIVWAVGVSIKKKTSSVYNFAPAAGFFQPCRSAALRGLFRPTLICGVFFQAKAALCLCLLLLRLVSSALLLMDMFFQQRPDLQPYGHNDTSS